MIMCWEAQEEVNNLFEYAKENDKEEENMSDDPVENTEEEVEGNNLLKDTFSNPSNGFDCAKCDFVAKTDAGLKTHNKKKQQILTLTKVKV